MIEAAPVYAPELTEAVRLLEEFHRGGEPVPENTARALREAVEAGDVEVLAVRAEGRMVGVAVLAYRLSVSAAGLFASIEDLYVMPAARRQGVGRTLLEAVERRCASRGVSYVEAQVEDEIAAALYSMVGYEEEPGVRIFSRSYVL